MEQQTYIISDSHYSHTNLCRGISSWKSGYRDFDTLEEMDNTLVDNINGKVGENDILYHLGDWSFGGVSKIKEFRDRINCKTIHLILGNHDLNIARNLENTQKLFNSVAYYREVLIEGKMFVLSHYAIHEWHNKFSKNASYHLYGHSHGNLKPSIKKAKVLELLEKGQYDQLKQLCLDDNYNPKSMDVGMDTNNLMPYHSSEIFELLKDRKEICDWSHFN